MQNIPPPTRQKNSAVRNRERLYLAEIDAIMVEASKRKLGMRDSLLLEITYRHALRPSEALHLLWDDIRFEERIINIYRSKTTKPSEHAMRPREYRRLLAWKKEQATNYEFYGGDSTFVFASRERGNCRTADEKRAGQPLSVRQFHRILVESARAAGIKFKVHPYMLRHTKAMELLGQDIHSEKIKHFMGHRSDGALKHYLSISSEAIADLSKIGNEWLDDDDDDDDNDDEDV